MDAVVLLVLTLWCEVLSTHSTAECGSYIYIYIYTHIYMYIRCVGWVKFTLVQALRLCTRRTAHRGSRGIALLFLDRGTRRGRVVSITPRPLFTSGKEPVPILQETGWASGPVWTGAENLVPTGIWSADRPARSQSLYRLSYRAHYIWYATAANCLVTV